MNAPGPRLAGAHRPQRPHLDTIATVPRSSEKTKRSRVRALPWALLLQAGLVVGTRISELSEKDRARLARLVRDSKGLPANLSEKERAELRKLVSKLDVKGMGRDLLPLMRGGAKGRKRR